MGVSVGSLDARISALETMAVSKVVMGEPLMSACASFCFLNKMAMGFIAMKGRVACQEGRPVSPCGVWRLGLFCFSHEGSFSKAMFVVICLYL